MAITIAKNIIVSKAESVNKLKMNMIEVMLKTLKDLNIEINYTMTSYNSYDYQQVERLFFKNMPTDNLIAFIDNLIEFTDKIEQIVE